MALRLEDIRTTEDGARAVPSHGRDWDDAVAAGIDVLMIEENLRLPPYERLRQHDQHARFRERVWARTVAPELRAEIEARRLTEKLAAFGVEAAVVIADIVRPSDGDR